jgi:hypothetical protein
MGFELYSSIYSDQVVPNSMAWNQYAAADEQTALLGFQRGTTVRRLPSVLPAGVPGGGFAIALNRPGWHIFFLTVWWGASHEVEAAVLYPVKRRAEAWHYLIEQVRTSAQVENTST